MKDSFVLYTSMLQSTRKLSLEQKGKLFEAIIEYQTTGEVPEIDDLAVDIYFDMIKNQMDIDNKKYKETLEKRREAGKKGGRPKKDVKENQMDNDEAIKSEMIDEKPNDFEKNQMENKKAKGFSEKLNDNENDNDNENVNNNILSHSSQNELQTFVKVWNEHAEKYGLPKVKELTNKRKKKLKSRLKDNPDFLKDFEKALKQVEYSSFLKGKKNGWKMDFDWLITNDTNYVRVIEGKYKDPESEETYEEPLYHL